jgi:hypothetical protein
MWLANGFPNQHHIHPLPHVDLKIEFNPKQNPYSFFLIETRKLSGCQWLTPAILATQKAEIRRIAVQGQPRQMVCETLS